ncbi:MAG TPA: AMIN domain-containing protein [Gemmatimonadaceae bacterium]|nr:AMIN domain-containing protein [Gemmatimonadaceae bacterium]
MLRAVACGAGAVLLSAATEPVRNDGAVTSLSILPTSSQARVVIGVDGAVRVRDFTLRNPDRIVLDITGATLGFKKGYDRVARGGVVDVRYAQNQTDVVRIVLTLSGPKHYEVTHEANSVVISVDGGGNFAAWRAGKPGMSSPALATKRTRPDTVALNASGSRITTVAMQADPMNMPTALPPQTQQQPRITITWENANIRDVIAGFAAYSGRTIIPARGVEATVSAEIINQPWDVAMKAILNAHGFDAVEDENGIIIVNTIEALAARPRYEPLITRTVRFNYTNAGAVAAALAQRLSRDCGEPVGVGGSTQGGAIDPSQQASNNQAAAQAAAQAATLRAISSGGTVDLRCPQRGAVTADTLTNSVSITDAPSNMDDIIAYARTLDVRQPQVNIKAKIILVDRTQIEGLGLKYDIGSPQQHFNDVVARVDSAGNVESGNVISLGGNAISAIANAAQSVPGATLSLVYSAALGAFSFTTFVDALQSRSLLDVQAEPSVTTLNYRPAMLSAGTQVPVRTIEQGTGGNAAGAFPQVTVQMRQTGIVLQVTPSITNNRQVMMKVHAENSDVLFQGGDIGAVFPTQSIDNEVLVADGETAVMGGLTQTSVTINKTGIPILMDLPLIGRLFGVTQRSETKRDLLILITPHIVDEGDMTMEPRRSP